MNRTSSVLFLGRLVFLKKSINAVDDVVPIVRNYHSLGSLR